MLLRLFGSQIVTISLLYLRFLLCNLFACIVFLYNLFWSSIRSQLNQQEIFNLTITPYFCSPFYRAHVRASWNRWCKIGNISNRRTFDPVFMNCLNSLDSHWGNVAKPCQVLCGFLFRDSDIYIPSSLGRSFFFLSSSPCFCNFISRPTDCSLVLSWTGEEGTERREWGDSDEARGELC